MEKKTVVLGITGGIAAYKIANLASKLSKENYDVHVIMTKNATNFITPLTFETLTGNKCIVDTFARDFEWDVKHVSIAKKADVFLVAPATANIIAKMAHGLADDMLSTTLLATNAKIIVSPAMNTAMYENKVTQRNIKILKELGHTVIEPDDGLLACKDIGKGRMPESDILYEYVKYALYENKDLLGKNVLVTAGATRESIDPVRYITNYSSGKMGYEIAKAAKSRGANVTLISGKTNLQKPQLVNVVDVCSASDMFCAVKEHFENADIIIKAAAVSDFTPIEVCDNKIKKEDAKMCINLKKTQDILAYLGENKKTNQILCGFSMETIDLIENSKKKLVNKNLDIIVANNLKDEGAGFSVDTNIVSLITKDNVINLPKMTKSEVAHKVLDRILTL